MKFTEADLPFMTGASFSNGRMFQVAVPNDPFDMDRFKYLEDKSRGKNILHIGFADHLPLIESKIKINKWLHKRLIDVSTKCVGIDIDDEVIDFVRNKLNIPDVLKLNVIEDEVPQSIKSEHWDYMILGEVLEHVDNPVQFLAGIKQRFNGLVDRLIITVPNATILHQVFNVRKGIEFINTDHRYWFTPYTLAKVGTRAGFTTEEFGYCQNWMPGTYFKRMLVKKYPMLRDSVVMVFTF